jgi:hypothetical protein
MRQPPHDIGLGDRAQRKVSLGNEIRPAALSKELDELESVKRIVAESANIGHVRINPCTQSRLEWSELRSSTALLESDSCRRPAPQNEVADEEGGENRRYWEHGSGIGPIELPCVA